MSQPHHRFSLRQLGPVMGHAPGREMVRASFGAFAAVLVVGLFLRVTGLGSPHGLHLIAPFGASSFLLFAVPNSPLAQPWSAIVGNGVAAIAGVAAALWIPNYELSLAAALGGAILLMHLTRALHPPGGAVALTAALSPEMIRDTGFDFVLSPVMLGTAMLVALAALYASLTGRRYPFRQTEPAHEPEPEEEPQRDPLGLTREELGHLLSDFRQSANIGVEDLARLIAAAEDRAAAMRLGTLTCGDIMTRNPATVDVQTTLPQVAELFAKLAFTALPVTDGDRNFRGMIFQIDLIRRGVEDNQADRRRMQSAVRSLFGLSRGVAAQDLMRSEGPRLAPDTPAFALLPILAEGVREAVPILESGRIIGIVTRTDLLARLEEELALRAASGR
ncbi:HPP family protein [Paracoccus aminophilus]|uniref:CBS domain-containing membrane protein n=1 Tax=Paracoccus aminophilus JCM 7686 TaxID=1367847 RepID=S5Y203_PARAH|nr:HPP family protein [Paracoccus aminophilus]AGT09765.1 CBS domain-containing membrane protein [Paracoccus aminophilus JCM 7686]